MPIIATGGDSKTYTPAPEGVHQAVCVDIIDLGLIKSQFPDEKTGADKWQHKINLVWQIGETRDDGSLFLLFKRYTLSLHEKANLRHDLESWRGRAFTEVELRGFDVESIKGVNCLINVQHKKSADGTKTYANVVSVMPLIKGMPKIAAVNYVRPEQATVAQPEPDPEPQPVTQELTDDDIPFAWMLPLALPLTGLLALGALWT